MWRVLMLIFGKARNRAWYEGQEDYYAGNGLDKCIYPEDSREYKAWMDGYHGRN